ncbi:hypothetical protein TNCV_3783441 [Trichonephila clavipes]|nr:hypothetical protein TNCV_3783441 [Trichonephila clavipes]
MYIIAYLRPSFNRLPIAASSSKSKRFLIVKIRKRLYPSIRIRMQSPDPANCRQEKLLPIWEPKQWKEACPYASPEKQEARPSGQGQYFTSTPISSSPPGLAQWLFESSANIFCFLPAQPLFFHHF